MRSSPVVSVIVPTFNYAHYIGQTLENLQLQTLEDWECLVVDDGSSDNTREVVQRYSDVDSRIKYYWQPNQKQPVARNMGLAQCSGNYIQFLDADDLLETRKFQSQVAFLEENPDVGIVYGRARFFDDSGHQDILSSYSESQIAKTVNIAGVGRQLLEYLVRGNMMTINGPLVRRDVVEAVGPFGPADLAPLEDWEYWLRCAAHGYRFRFEDLDGTMALVRRHSTSSSNCMPMPTARVLVHERIDALIEEKDLRQLNRQLWAESLARLAVEYSDGKADAARRMFEAARIDSRWRAKLRWLVCSGASFVRSKRSSGASP